MRLHICVWADQHLPGCLAWRLACSQRAPFRTENSAQLGRNGARRRNTKGMLGTLTEADLDLGGVAVQDFVLQVDLRIP